MKKFIKTIMKKIKLVLIIGVAVSIFSACGGDHSASHGEDTVKNSYQVPHDSTKVDTSKVTPADATTLDNSASGGTKIKDTSGMKKK